MSEAPALTGTCYRSVDRKGRVVLPEPFRSQLGERFVLTRAPERHLVLLPADRWQRLLSASAEDDTLREFYVSGAVSPPIDRTSQRIMVPEALRSWAGLRPFEEVALVGIGEAVLVAPRVAWDARICALERRLLASMEGVSFRDHA